MWSVAGWELRVFIPLDRPPATTAQGEEGGGQEQQQNLDVFQWAKRHKKDLKKKARREEEGQQDEEAKRTNSNKKLQKEGKKKKNKDKKKAAKKNKKKGSKLFLGKKGAKEDDNDTTDGGKEEEEEEESDEQATSKKDKKKKGGPTERRTDFYIRVDSAAPSHRDGADDDSDAMELADGEAEAALAQWVEEGCGLKLRGGAWGHQLELKVRTASEAAAEGDAASLRAERWVKLALPRVSGDDVVLPPCTMADLVALHRAVGAAVVDDHHGEGGSEAWLGGGWRGLVRAAGQFVRQRLFAAQDEEAAHERAQVVMARQAIGRRLMIAAGVAGDIPHEPETHPEDQRDAEAPEALPEPSASTSAPSIPAVEEKAVTAMAEAPLCGLWRVDKARRQRSIKWPVPAYPSTDTPVGEEATGEEHDDDHRKTEVLVVEQTDIFIFTYRTSTVPEASEVARAELREERCGEFVSVCVEGGSPDVLRSFMAAFLSSLPPQRQPLTVGYPAWIAHTARHHPRPPPEASTASTTPHATPPSSHEPSAPVVE